MLEDFSCTFFTFCTWRWRSHRSFRTVIITYKTIIIVRMRTVLNSLKKGSSLAYNFNLLISWNIIKLFFVWLTRYQIIPIVSLVVITWAEEFIECFKLICINSNCTVISINIIVSCIHFFSSTTCSAPNKASGLPVIRCHCFTQSSKLVQIITIFVP